MIDITNALLFLNGSVITKSIDCKHSPTSVSHASKTGSGSGEFYHALLSHAKYERVMSHTHQMLSHTHIENWK